MPPIDDVVYPQNPEEWQTWLQINLGIDSAKGKSMAQEDRFPLEQLVALWNARFNSEKGYSPSFIPALVRNKMGFVKWIYLDGPEPNWTKSD